MYKAKKDALYENRVSAAGHEAMAGRPPLTGSCRITVEARFQIPKSASKKKRADMLAGSILPTKKPDLSNVLKAVEDGLNTIVFSDDAQIVEAFARKIYSDTPCVVVRVEPLSPETEQ